MTSVALDFTLLSLAYAVICAGLPNRLFTVLAPMASAAGFFVIAPFSLVWMVCLVVAAQLAFVYGRLPKSRSLAAFAVIIPAILSLLLLREIDWLTTLGAAYFCLRIVHVMLDWWMEKIAAPKPMALINYMFFFPTFLVGPINRYPEFERELERRRISHQNFVEGAERVLVGLFMAIVLGGILIDLLNQHLPDPGPFLADWTISALGWIDLYFVFAGLSGVALGISLISGIRISENFNHPYKARTLVEFWSRWHISLTSWCRDYVFAPISTLTRKPVLGVFLAMFVLGLWHESSLFYICWAAWQAAGIVMSRVLAPLYKPLPEWLDMAISPVLILGWLSLANPIVNRLVGSIS